MSNLRRRITLAIKLVPLLACNVYAAPVTLDTRFTLSTRVDDIRAFALGVDPRGEIYAVTGLRPDDQLVRVDSAGTKETVIDRLGCGVGALTTLELGFDGRWFTTAGSDVVPEARGVVTFDARAGGSGMFSRGRVDSSDGRLSFDPWARTMLMVNSASRDLVEIDRQGRRRVLASRVGANPCGLAVTGNGSSIVLDRSGKLVAVSRTGRSAKPLVDLATLIPGHYFLSLKCETQSGLVWFLASDGRATTLYRMELNTLEPEPVLAGDDLVGLCVGPAGNKAVGTSIYFSSPTSGRIYELNPSAQVTFASVALAYGAVPARLSLREASERAAIARAALQKVRATAAAQFEASAAVQQIVSDSLSVTSKLRTVGDTIDRNTFAAAAMKLMVLRSQLSAARTESLSSNSEVRDAEIAFIAADLERQSIEMSVRNRIASRFADIHRKVELSTRAETDAVNADPVLRAMRDGIIALGMSRAQVDGIARRAGCSIGGELVAASVDGSLRVVWKLPGGVDVLNVKQRSTEPYELCGDFKDDKLVSFMKMRP